MVRNSSRSRRGNAAPLAVASGTDKITASETAPRVPHQPKITRSLLLEELTSGVARKP